MHIIRRNFLKNGFVSAISIAFGIATARLTLGQRKGRGQITLSPGPPTFPSSDLGNPVYLFRPDTFSPYVGDFFQAPNSRGGMVPLRLASMKVYHPSDGALGLTGTAPETESFTLLFKADARLPSFVTIHKISHPALGEFELFVTERITEDGFSYEAVINHLR